MTYPDSIETREDLTAIAAHEPETAGRMLFTMSAELAALRDAVKHIVRANDTDEGAVLDVEYALGQDAAGAVRRALQ